MNKVSFILHMYFVEDEEGEELIPFWDVEVDGQIVESKLCREEVGEYIVNKLEELE